MESATQKTTIKKMKTWKRIGLFLLALLVILTLVFWEKGFRFYKIVNLFKADEIIANFKSMPSIMPSAVIKQSGSVREFEVKGTPLPETFIFEGKSLNVSDALKETDTLALVVVKGEALLHESYHLGSKPEDRFISWSVSKSFISALFGIALEEGNIESLSDLVVKYVPELKGTGYEGVTLKNLLQMSSGVLFNEDYLDFNSDINKMGRILALGGSMDAFAASLGNEHKPGTFNHYVSIDTHVLAMILRKATGKNITEYTREKLWSKTGMEADGIWLEDTHGAVFALGGLNVRPRDYLRMGMLFRDLGKYQGEQIVAEGWIMASTRPNGEIYEPGKRAESTSVLGYGYQWWVPVGYEEGEYFAHGIYNQFIYVNTKANIVIVKNSANREFKDNNSADTHKTIALFRGIVKQYANE